MLMLMDAFSNHPFFVSLVFLDSSNLVNIDLVVVSQIVLSIIAFKFTPCGAATKGLGLSVIYILPLVASRDLERCACKYCKFVCLEENRCVPCTLCTKFQNRCHSVLKPWKSLTCLNAPPFLSIVHTDLPCI